MINARCLLGSRDGRPVSSWPSWCTSNAMNTVCAVAGAREHPANPAAALAPVGRARSIKIWFRSRHDPTSWPGDQRSSRTSST